METTKTPISAQTAVGSRDLLDTDVHPPTIVAEASTTLTGPFGTDPILLLSSIEDGSGPRVAVVVSRGASVLLLCRELNGHTRSQWSIPEGQRDANETPEGCATRRVHEDSGIRVDRGVLLTLGTVGSGPQPITTLFFVNLDEDQPLQPGQLVAAAEWFPAVMAVESAADGNITDSLTCLALLRASVKGLL